MSTVLPFIPLETNADLAQPRKRRRGGKSFDEVWAYPIFLLKTWVMDDIPFEVIENPFVVNLFKELNPAYVSTSRTTLSGRLLDEEVARVQNEINNNLENAEHLTLMLDGWTSK
ncbi:hypothetical protein C1645_834962 [Glomus cerebriforme]|uniref:DUF659 domain-containing protein n=1 Tax=Glomus cerebriforme TaxID=658196 RepID=A0A397SJJ7_9GLOM|nr:hypothetical protein C1645_834962 [Glomus cerebriforme]